MTRDGSQYVCGKCGAWCDPGVVQAPAPVSARALLLALADRLDEQPNRPTDWHTVRGWARSAGLTGDWLEILPPPAGAHHSTYAVRLRTLAGGC